MAFDLYVYLEKLKAANPIEEVAVELGLKFSKGSRNALRVAHSGGLILTPSRQSFYHFSKGTHGDVIQLAQDEKGWEWKAAVEWLAQRGRIELPNWKSMSNEQLAAHRVRVNIYAVAQRLFQEWLWKDAAAVGYARGRGFDDETICGDVTAEDALDKDAPYKFKPRTIEKAEKAAAGNKYEVVASGAGFGFSGRNTQAQISEMKKQFQLYGTEFDHPAAVTILGYEGDVKAWADKWKIDRKSDEWKEEWEESGRLHGMMRVPGIVYQHVYGGQTSYLTRRNMPGHDNDGKWKSFNPQKALVGEKHPYFNHIYKPMDEECAIVEGPADAEAFAELGWSAVALCGVHASEEGAENLKARLRNHKRLYVALDRDATGAAKREKVAQAFGATTRIVEYDIPAMEDEDDYIEADDE